MTQIQPQTEPPTKTQITPPIKTHPQPTETQTDLPDETSPRPPTKTKNKSHTLTHHHRTATRTEPPTETQNEPPTLTLPQPDLAQTDHPTNDETQQPSDYESRLPTMTQTQPNIPQKQPPTETQNRPPDEPILNQPAIYPEGPYLNRKISEEELLTALASLNKSSSPGPDAITYNMIALSDPTLLSEVLRLLNASFLSSYIPEKWKLAEIYPLPKTNNPTRPSDYRPISLLPCISKILEKVILSRIQHHLTDHNLNSPMQSGFTSGRSTTKQILRVISLIHKAWSHDQDVLYISLDISKAFDSVPTAKLVHKLKTIYSLQGPILHWLTAFLTDRKFFVRISQCSSETHPSQNGVPQGSILAATLFAMYIADLPDTLPSSVHISLYADDSNIFAPIPRTPGPERDQAISSIQTALNNVTDWGSKWDLQFHKLQPIIFSPHGSNSPNIDPATAPTITFRNAQISLHDNEPVRLLGVWLDQQLTMKPHIDKLIARTIPRIQILRSISATNTGADRSTLLKLYTSWIRPVIEYSSICYATASPKTLQKLDKLQSQALKIVTGATRTASNPATHFVTNTPSLGIRRLKQAANMFATLQRSDLSDICTTTWTEWKTSQKYFSSSSTTNFFQPARQLSSRHRLNTPYHFILHAAQILQLTQADTDPEPILPPPDIRFRLPIRPHPDDVNPAQPNQTDFGPAGARSPTQRKAANDYANATLQSHLISLPNNGLILFTDGSNVPDIIGGSGIGIVAMRTDRSIAWQTSKSTQQMSTSYAAELLAIDHALKEVLKITSKDPFYTSSIVILCDCLSAVKTSRNPPTTPNHSYWTTWSSIHQSKTNLRSNNIQVRFDWIPGHAGLEGNEHADRLAKFASDRSRAGFPPNLTIAQPISMSKGFTARNIKAAITSLYISNSKCKSLKNLCPHAPPHNPSRSYTKHHLSRQVQITIDRILIGDYPTGTRLHKIDPNISPNCKHCPTKPETTNHMLIDCPKYSTQRSSLQASIWSTTSGQGLTLSLATMTGQHPNISSDDRTTIILALANFLKSSSLLIPPWRNPSQSSYDPP